VKLVRDHGPDAVRYFLLREGVYGQDWDFTDAAFITRFNADLANDLGNLVSRALTMARNYCEGKVPPRPGLPPAGALGCEVQLQTDAALGDPAGLRQRVLDRYEQLDFAAALGEIWSWVSQLNQRIVQQAPWEMAKDPARRGELDAFLYRLLEAIRVSAVLVGPVMPRAAARILGMLAREAGEPARVDLEWGRLEPGRALGAIEALFPRLDKAGAAPIASSAKNASVASSPKKEKPVSEPSSPEPVVSPVAAVSPAPASSAAPASVPVAAAAGAVADKIDIADFAKVELRVAQVLEAEKIPGSKKLLKLQVDLGDEKRQIVAGIADSYAPEALVGRKVVIVANLKPAKLMGVESNGMVLAATHEGKAVLLSVEGGTAPGSKVR
jgi:methionyl-tRNA synthetase